MTSPRKILALALSATIAAGVGAGPALAAEVTPAEVAGEASVATLSPLTAPIEEGKHDNWRRSLAESPHRDRVEEINAYSPSMGRDIPLAVIRATHPDGSAKDNAPTIYALNGAGGAEQGLDWFTASDALEFYLDKGVNVVVPMAGAFSYYLDWYAEPSSGAILNGPQMWETFLTKELPGPIEAHLNGSNQRAVLGYSMSATPALLFAEHNPGFYDAVGSFSGCAAMSTPLEYGYAGITVNRGGINIENMLGPVGGGHAVHNDALINAEGLRGTEVYVSNGSGLAGPTDLQSYRHQQAAAEGLTELQSIIVGAGNTLTLQVEGGVIEAAANACTHNLQAKTDALGIAVDYNFRDQGTHDWPYWDRDIVDSWPTFARGFGWS